MLEDLVRIWEMRDTLYNQLPLADLYNLSVTSNDMHASVRDFVLAQDAGGVGDWRERLLLQHAAREYRGRDKAMHLFMLSRDLGLVLAQATMRRLGCRPDVPTRWQTERQSTLDWLFDAVVAPHLAASGFDRDALFNAFVVEMAAGNVYHGRWDRDTQPSARAVYGTFCFEPHPGERWPALQRNTDGEYRAIVSEPLALDSLLAWQMIAFNGMCTVNIPNGRTVVADQAPTRSLLSHAQVSFVALFEACDCTDTQAPRMLAMHISDRDGYQLFPHDMRALEAIADRVAAGDHSVSHGYGLGRGGTLVFPTIGAVYYYAGNPGPLQALVLQTSLTRAAVHSSPPVLDTSLGFVVHAFGANGTRKWRCDESLCIVPNAPPLAYSDIGVRSRNLHDSTFIELMHLQMQSVAERLQLYTPAGPVFR